MARWVFLNNGFVEEEKALIHFNDLSFQRGYGIFDFFRLVENSPLFIKEHLDRFFFSAQGMHLPVPLSKSEIKSVVFELIKKNGMPFSGVRLSLSGGQADDGFSIGSPGLVISQHPFSPPSAEQVENGLRLFSYPFQRQLPHIKSIDYLMAVWLQPKRAENGTDDILYHQNGFISESPRSNFFLVNADGTIVTPADNVLAGITRSKVIQLAKKYYSLEERAVSVEELKGAKGAFITSTTKQVLPVARVDDIILPEKKIAHHLLQLFRSTCLTE